MPATSNEKAVSVFSMKQMIAAGLFLVGALGLSQVVPSIEIAWVTGLLMLTIYLFAFEMVGVDVAAISVMVLLGLSSLFAPLIDGFASNAVMSIIAVMIIGAGLDKTGLMSKVAAFILKAGGTSEKRIIPIISFTVGIISSFMQNVGAAALFLPVVARISARTGLPMSRLLMPMGFCAILGGTVTMVGSSPLILLNDLILASNQALPADQQMETWGLFSVTPIGLVLVFTGIVYFVLAGRFVLPATHNESATSGADPLKYIQETYGVDYALSEVVLMEDSLFVGKTLDKIESLHKLRVVASKRQGSSPFFGEGALARDTELSAGMVLGVVAEPEHLTTLSKEFKFMVRDELRTFSEALSSAKSGIAEIVIPPGSKLVGKSARDVWLRKTYGIALIGLHRNGETKREGEDIRNMPFAAGDTLVVHVTWDMLQRIEKNRDFVVVTTEYPKEEARPQKLVPALIFFVIALSLVLFTDLRLSVALLTGAIGMILSGVLKVEEAYDAVSWKTVFLLASLIPLGVAVESSGTAKWIAEQTLAVMGENPEIWMVQLVIAVLATFFTLVMSNVGATVLLVPLAINIALQIPGANPAVFALTVAIATSNSFLIPTHQVNALIMGPGGYRVPDFMRAGGIMTVLFLVVMMVMMGIVFD